MSHHTYFPLLYLYPGSATAQKQQSSHEGEQKRSQAPVIIHPKTPGGVVMIQESSSGVEKIDKETQCIGNNACVQVRPVLLNLFYECWVKTAN